MKTLEIVFIWPRESWSISLYTIDRRYTDNLDPQIKGVIFWDKIDNSVGYYVFDHLSGSSLPIEYDKGSCQWVFIALNTRSRKWIATDTVPQTFRLGRQSIRHSTVQAVEVDKKENLRASETVKEEKTSNVPSSMITDNIHHLAMSQTMAALTLARTATTGSQFMGFSRKGKGPVFPPYVPGSGGGLSQTHIFYLIFLYFIRIYLMKYSCLSPYH